MTFQKFFYLLVVLASCAGLLLSQNNALAQAFPPGVGGTPATTPTSGGACNWSAIMASIQATESGGSGCNTPGPMTSYGQAAGMYQFIPPTWNAMAASCPNASMCPHASQAFYTNPVCCQVQQCAMGNLLASNAAGIKNNSACQQLLGKQVNSPKYGSCTVTLSGILAAWHLGGPKSCAGVVANGLGAKDSLGTYVVDYMCRHSGIPVPTNCTPPPGTNNNTYVVATAYQLTIQGPNAVVGAAPPNPLMYWWVFGLQMMASQFTTTMLWQVQAIGMLLDAKHQLETQRLFQQKTAEAHRDYQPSEQMCTFGTFVRDLATSQRSAEFSKEVIAKDMLQREVGEFDTKALSTTSDSLSRISNFVKKFCNPADNGNGLDKLCPTAAPKATQNADINYTASIDQKLSMKIDLTDTVTTTDEEIVFALLDNLFMHNPPDRLAAEDMDKRKYQYHYMNYRSLVAMRGIAKNTIANIIAMKSESTFTSANSSAPYLKSLMTEFGLSNQEIDDILGQNPSYYAQMELLTKKMYQNPSFYTVLIDKPANVKRIRAAMRAIKVMQDRDIEAALKRREMLLSMMLELRLREQADKVYNATEKAMYE